ncbi:glucose-1-phosphate thymidylyltransferase [candidate division CSSED10-310 bacterium]|uniref:Glucose-1-phosphate thymidylyltransferase n=1 Tax=candidate division CSSED10-310 bacterium TaxID=2855610 RepID=A0ABV6YSK5_UNCC1
MKALILAGGSGTRLRPITYTGAKQLVPVANKPILFYVIDNIVSAGIKDIGIIISPETGQEIQKAVDEAQLWDAKMTYITQEKPLGLAHAVLTAQPFLAESPFVMYLGDNLIGIDINSFVHSFQVNTPEAQILLKEVENPSSFGIATVDEQGRVIRLVEKPKIPESNLALIGIYIFSPKIFDAIHEIKPSWRGELEITDAIQKLIDWNATVYSSIIQEWWLDTGKKDDLLNANRIVLDELLKTDIRGSYCEESKITGRVVLPEDSEVINSYIRGPVILGHGVRIEDSFVGPFSSIGNKTRIIGSSVEHVVLLENCQVNGISRLEDSIMGRNAIVRKINNIRRAVSLIVSDDSIVEF